MANDSDKLRNYVRMDAPQIDGNDRKYLHDELQKIQDALSLLVTVTKQIDAHVVALDARCVAHGI